MELVILNHAAVVEGSSPKKSLNNHVFLLIYSKYLEGKQIKHKAKSKLMQIKWMKDGRMVPQAVFVLMRGKLYVHYYQDKRVY